MAMRTQLNATHPQLNKKLRMNDFLTISTFSERRLFLNNHSIEFHKNLAGRYFRERLSERLHILFNLTEEILKYYFYTIIMHTLLSVCFRQIMKKSTDFSIEFSANEQNLILKSRFIHSCYRGNDTHATYQNMLVYPFN